MKYEDLGNNKYVYEFGSMKDYIDFLQSDKEKLLSNNPDSHNFYGTKDLNQAFDLATHGWSDVAVELNKKLNFATKQMGDSKYLQKFLSQAGYQAIVPLYLNGVPTNMVNARMQVKKQKIITIVKSVGFRGCESIKQIKDESVKTLMIVKMLESKGYRVNLYTLNGFAINNKKVFVRVKVKSANEKLNISKLAFPLVHPSMLRRLNFRFREIELGAKYDMGSSFYSKRENAVCLKKDEVYIPSFMEKSINEIKNIDDVECGLSFEEKH